MANELRLSFNVAGDATITADVYQPDGTEREFTIALSDTGHQKLYLGDCALLETGDIIHYYQGTDLVASELYGLTYNQPVSGAVVWDYVVTDTISGLPVPDVTVVAQVSGNSIQSRITDATGTASFFLVPGTYDFYSVKVGYNFTNPDTEVVS